MRAFESSDASKVFILFGLAAIVIAAGRYRSGKSFLMGQLCPGAAFAVGHTIESHTKGIWLCGEPVQTVTTGGEEIDVLFMDSEGLGASDKVSILSVPQSMHGQCRSEAVPTTCQPRLNMRPLAHAASARPGQYAHVHLLPAEPAARRVYLQSGCSPLLYAAV